MILLFNYCCFMSLGRYKYEFSVIVILVAFGVSLRIINFDPDIRGFIFWVCYHFEFKYNQGRHEAGFGGSSPSGTLWY